MVCGVTWKGCPCPEADEDRLYPEAERRLRRALPIENAIGNAPPIDVVRRVAAALRVNHECEHDHWNRISNRMGNRANSRTANRTGMIQCEGCDHWIPFVLECTNCRLRLCHRCMRNRL